jgi:hypothetical protein
MHQNKFVMSLLVGQVILDMFLIHLIFLLNHDLSIKKRKTMMSFLLLIDMSYIVTLKEPVEATLVLAADANDPRLG